MIAAMVELVDAVPVEVLEVMVADALASIPAILRSQIENLAIIIDDESPPGPLYGLYEGVPLTRRGDYSATMPDRITIFLATLCAASGSADELALRVRTTVLHEVGHHFGIGEARLAELGWA